MSSPANTSAELIAARVRRTRRAGSRPARTAREKADAPPAAPPRAANRVAHPNAPTEPGVAATPTPPPAPPGPGAARVHIVYFVNCMLNKNWASWVRGQMLMARPLGAAAVHVEATVTAADTARLSRIVHTALAGTVTRVHVRTHGEENQFEYPGIMRAWRLGRKHAETDDLIMYVHSKGVTHQNTFDRSMAAHICGRIMREHRHIREVLRTRSDINKVALIASDRGFAWYNFWWARASYLSGVERPIRTERRHYYERWLSKHVAPHQSIIADRLHRDTETYDVHNASDVYDLSLRRIVEKGRTGHHAGRVVARAHARRLSREIRAKRRAEAVEAAEAARMPAPPKSS